MEPKVYTLDELIRWMMNQPNDRPVNMKTGFRGQEQCGCLMSEFGKDMGLPEGYSFGKTGEFKDRNHEVCAIIEGIESLEGKEACKVFNLFHYPYCGTFGGLKKNLIEGYIPKT